MCDTDKPSALPRWPRQRHGGRRHQAISRVLPSTDLPAPEERRGCRKAGGKEKEKKPKNHTGHIGSINMRPHKCPDA